MDYKATREKLGLSLDGMARLIAVKNAEYVDELERFKRYPTGPVATLYAVFNLVDEPTLAHLKLMLLGDQ